MYLKREHHSGIIDLFNSDSKSGLIVAGIVGCGKTTLIEACLKDIHSRQVFSFSGDDTLFRTAVSQDSKYIHSYITSKTLKPALVFVDEVQKSETIFDALKYAFDKADISFIVSGSNPHFLCENARQRLQRRADLFSMGPFSLTEILAHEGYFDLHAVLLEFLNLLSEQKMPEISIFDGVVDEKLSSIIEKYFSVGGLPLSYMKEKETQSFREIAKTVDRGFSAMFRDSENISEIVKIELAKIHSLEFSYQSLFQKTRIRSRKVINDVIIDLKNHGYIFEKKPIIFDEGRTSYLSIFSYVDPGIVTYLSSQPTDQENLGRRVEGYVHSRLESLRTRMSFKNELGYFKPYIIDREGKLKFLQGEIDFIVRYGKRIIPIEVKATDNRANIHCPVLKKFIKDKKLPFGVVLYGGVPYWEESEKLIYWPYWMI